MKLGKLNSALRAEKVVCARIDTPHGAIAVRVQKTDLIKRLGELYEHKGTETGLVFEDNVLSFAPGHKPEGAPGTSVEVGAEDDDMFGDPLDEADAEDDDMFN